MPRPFVFVMHETNRKLRGHAFLPGAKELAKLPKPHAQDKAPAPERIAHLHYFGGPFDLWVVEGQPDLEDPEDPDFEFFGYVALSHMPEGAEWGYQSARYLERQVLTGPPGLSFVIERDCYWDPRPMWQCERSGLTLPGAGR
jgi:hypothetical protein